MVVGNTPVPPEWFALSVKQPWAALLVAGLKTVEVRTWLTRRRGLVLIHASKSPDERPEGWAALDSPQLRAAASVRGGIIGMGRLADCRRYGSPAAFAMDHLRHHNAAAWFRPPGMFGLVFQDVKAVPFYPYQGQTMFFRVRGYSPPLDAATDGPVVRSHAAGDDARRPSRRAE